MHNEGDVRFSCGERLRPNCTCFVGSTLTDATFLSVWSLSLHSHISVWMSNLPAAYRSVHLVPASFWQICEVNSWRFSDFLAWGFRWHVSTVLHLNDSRHCPQQYFYWLSPLKMIVMSLSVRTLEVHFKVLIAVGLFLQSCYMFLHLRWDVFAEMRASDLHFGAYWFNSTDISLKAYEFF